MVIIILKTILMQGEAVFNWTLNDYYNITSLANYKEKVDSVCVTCEEGWKLLLVI